MVVVNEARHNMQSYSVLSGRSWLLGGLGALFAVAGFVRDEHFLTLEGISVALFVLAAIASKTAHSFDKKVYPGQ